LGQWQVEPDLGRLRSDGKEVYLRPQLMQALLLLVEQPGALVPTSLLIERVWARRFVSASVVARCIADLRHALDDNARSPAYIETLAKRGYRLAACVLPPVTPRAQRPVVTALQPVEKISSEPAVVRGWQDVFVGRDREMGMLAGRLQQALRGSGGAVFVTGEAGSGKSALLWEFARRATATYRELLVVSARGEARTGLGEPLGLCRDLLSLLSGDVQSRATAGELDPEQADRLWHNAPEVMQWLVDTGPALVGRLIPSGPLLERARAVAVAPPVLKQLCKLAQAAATSSSGQEWSRHEQLAGLICDLLLHLAARSPLLVVLDDLQWCDTASQTVIFRLARCLARPRILLAGAFRSGAALNARTEPNSFDDLAAELASRSDAGWVNLDQAPGREFVEALLDAEPNRLDAGFRARFTSSTAGNPLLSTELLRALQECQWIAPDARRAWQASPELDWSRVPERLDPVLSQRINRVPQRLRLLLNAAAVEGEEFTAEVAAAVLGRDSLQVIAELGGILDRQHHLLTPVRVQRLGKTRRSTYRFRHALIQSWLYAQLGEPEQASLHERIARANEHLYPGHLDSLAGPLAFHFAAADLPEEAITHYRQAARQATMLAADREALQLLRCGLELIPRLLPGKDRDRTELDLRLAEGLSLIALRGYAAPEVMECLPRIRALCQRTGEQGQWFGMLWQYNIVAGLRADYAAAFKAAQEMVVLARKFPDPNPLAVAFLARGWIQVMRGRFAAALADLGRTLEMKGDPGELAATYGCEPRATALAWCSWAHWFRSDFAAARDCAARSVALARESGHAMTLAFALGVAGASLHNCLGEPDEALRDAAEVETLASKHDLAFYKVGVQLYRGFAHVQQGRDQIGLEELGAGLAGWSAGGTYAYRGYHLALAALAHRRLGHVPQALETARQALEHVATSGETMFEPEIRHLHALILHAAGSTPEARAELRRAIQVARRQNSLTLLQRALETLSRFRVRDAGRLKDSRFLLDQLTVEKPTKV
jgi:DNA-binding winged helix-turn-helix (wHTH) protein/tetratricopeptide (TPR) repeat protein